MKRVLILVEGQTEETFVRDVLAHHLMGFDLFPVAVIVKTKRTKSGPSFKGGVREYARIHNDVMRLLNDSDAIAVTTMLDYYGLPHDTPGLGDLRAGNCYDRVAHVERAIDNDIKTARADPRFKAFLTLHEFEGLLFSDPDKIAMVLDRPVTLFQDIVAQVSSPEEINEGQHTHPSARMISLAPGYEKPFHGGLIALETGLAQIRRKCPHFAGWVEWLELLAQA
jgi:hypothetical protein